MVLTARARKPLFGPAEGELVLLEMPRVNAPLAEQNLPWRETVLAKGPDVMFEVGKLAGHGCRNNRDCYRKSALVTSDIHHVVYVENPRLLLQFCGDSVMVGFALKHSCCCHWSCILKPRGITNGCSVDRM